MAPKTFTEFRADGWPLCPQCGEDELYSNLMLSWTKLEPPPLRDCVDSGMQCYRCDWKTEGRNIFGGKCFRCDLFFSRPADERDYIYCRECRMKIKNEQERERIHAEVESMEWPEFVA